MFSIFAALITLGGFVNAQGYVSLPFTMESSNGDLLTNTPLQKRLIQGKLDGGLDTLYTVSITLGDNQKQKCILDTGSSELWVYSNKLIAQEGYDPSGAEFISDDFQMEYPDGTKANGSYYKDKLTLDGFTVDAQFGVSEIEEELRRSWWGRFGIGRRDTENSCLEGKAAYDSYPYLLRNVGRIEVAAYSLNLNTNERNVGHVLFGGVDTKQYLGKLQLLDSQSDSSFSVQFNVEGSTLIGEIDSASRDTYLPDDILSRFAASIGARWEEESKSYYTDRINHAAVLTFNFSGTEVSISGLELLKPFNQFGSFFWLSVKPSSQRNGRIILGESFLRSAYTVFDLENNRVAIAQAFKSDSHDYQPIAKTYGIPGASY